MRDREPFRVRMMSRSLRRCPPGFSVDVFEMWESISGRFKLVSCPKMYIKISNEGQAAS